MSTLNDIWKAALPEMRNAVTGVGVWQALNACHAMAHEGETLVLGLPHKDMGLSGHLTSALTKRVIEKEMTARLGSSVTIRIIDGTTLADWERVLRKDEEAGKLREVQRQKILAEKSAKSNWDIVYEQLSRKFAAVANKGLPQNKAKFCEEGIALVAENRQTIVERDDLAERNFARCIERLAQYSDLPTTLIAHMVMERVGEL